MSEVTLSPIPAEGGNINDLRTGDVCPLGNSMYFTIHSQRNPSYVFGTVISVANEGTDSPSSTILRSQVLTGLGPASQHTTYTATKMDDDHIMVVKQSSNTSYAFLLKIDSANGYQISQVASEIQIPMAASSSGPWGSSLFTTESVSNGIVGVAYVAYPNAEYMVDKFTWDGTTFARTNIFTDSSNSTSNDDNAHAYLIKSKDDDSFAAYFVHRNGGNSSLSGQFVYNVKKGSFTDGQAWTSIIVGGTTGIGQALFKGSTGEFWLFGDRTKYEYNNGQNDAILDAWVSGTAGDNYTNVYTEWHQVGNDHPDTFVYIYNTQFNSRMTDSNYTNMHDYRIIVGKIGDDGTPQASPSASAILSMTNGGYNVYGMTRVPSPFHKVSESCIAYFGVINPTNGTTNSFVWKYINY